MCRITLEEVQRATARCLEKHPVVNCVLPHESTLLVNLLGRMYYERSPDIDDGALPIATREALQQWRFTAPASLTAQAGTV